MVYLSWAMFIISQILIVAFSFSLGIKYSIKTLYAKAYSDGWDRCMELTNKRIGAIEIEAANIRLHREAGEEVPRATIN